MNRINKGSMMYRVGIAILTMGLLSGNASLGHPRHHIPQHENDQGPQLPEVGSSLFDKIFSKLNEKGQPVYDVPYPLEKLMNRLQGGQVDYIHSLFPFSRSLQRPQDLSYDPLENPRIVLSTNSDRDSLTRAKFFMGFVKAKDQIEVISYNDEAGRFEFQIVTDYSHNPKVFYVDRGKCLSCHQGQAPIFAIPGWQNSNFGIMGRLLLAKHGYEADTLENQKKVLHQLFGPLNSHNEVATFDLLVRESNQIALDERVWFYGCGNDNACRLGYLLKTLAPQSRHTRLYWDQARQRVKFSPLMNQSYFHSFLSSTSLGATRVIEKYGSYQAVARSPEALLEIVGLLYNLSPRNNPATPRLLSLKSKDLFLPLAGFSWADLEILRRQIPNQDQVAQILIEKYKRGDVLFSQKPLQKPLVMATLLEEINSSEAEKYRIWISKPTPQKELFQGSLLPTFERRELNLLARHCHRCHATDMAFPPQFLTGDEETVLTKIRALKNRVLFKLENNLMPPREEDRELLKSSGDYELILDFVRNL